MVMVCAAWLRAPGRHVEARRIEQVATRRQRGRHPQLHHPPEDRAEHALAPLVRLASSSSSTTSAIIEGISVNSPPRPKAMQRGRQHHQPRMLRAVAEPLEDVPDDRHPGRDEEGAPLPDLRRQPRDEKDHAEGGDRA
jgi:hypothetical protein